MPPQHPTTPNITAQRRARREKARRSLPHRLGRVGIALAAVFSAALAAAAIWGALAYRDLSADLPSIAHLPALLDAPNGELLQPTQLYDRTGQTVLLTLQNPHAAQARPVTLEELPPYAINAVLAAQDPGFWTHGGFTYTTEENTTLAERLVGELLLAGEAPGLNRTLRAKLLAAQITAHYGREVVLTWYLNHANFGQLAYGIDTAAQVYYDKHAADLTLAEAALLAASLPAPALNPIEAPQIALQRQSEILQNMLAYGLIDTDQALNANQTPIQIQPPAPTPASLAPDFTALVLSQLAGQFSPARVQRGGLTIITTLDLELQTQAECALNAQLGRLQGELALDELGAYDCEAARLLPSLQSKDTLGQENSQAGLVILDPTNGQILALIGDTSQAHAPGTSLTPLIYLTAFTRGLSPATLVWDIPSSLPPALATYSNHDNQFHGPMRMRTALANDYLVPALATLTQIGPNNAWRIAQQSGLTSLPIEYDEQAYHLILNQGAVSLLQIAQAYGMFANHGTVSGQVLPTPGSENSAHLQSAAVLQVRDGRGQVLVDWAQPVKQALVPPQLAYLVTDILADDLARQRTLGHPNPLQVGRPAAAKLGRSYSGADKWVWGYTPQRVIGVWLGTPEGENDSALPAAGLWHALVKTAHQDLPLQNWQEPPGLAHIAVCDPSGLLPTSDCPNVVTEIFNPGSEPLQADNLYRTYLINSQTGRLATVYTPPEYIQQRVYLVVPPEAAAWAQAAGLDTPPDDYDAVFDPGDSLGPAAISAPQVFGYVSGEIPITGRATGDNFAYYRVQVGEGLNPRQWLQIGVDVSSPVADGTLVTWDTTGFDGLYAIQLLVVNQDQTVENAIIQVTVDNQPPQILITLPGEGQRFSYPQETDITIQAQVSDNLGVARVEMYVNDQQIANLNGPPYAAPWQGSLGTHIVRVVAYDLAGNQSETSITFVIER